MRFPEPPTGAAIADAATVKSRFFAFGGVARAMFFDVEFTAHVDKVDTAFLAHQSVEALSDLAKARGQTQDKDVAHTLMGCDVNWSDDPDHQN